MTALQQNDRQVKDLTGVDESSIIAHETEGEIIVSQLQSPVCMLLNIILFFRWQHNILTTMHHEYE